MYRRALSGRKLLVAAALAVAAVLSSCSSGDTPGSSPATGATASPPPSPTAPVVPVATAAASGVDRLLDAIERHVEEIRGLSSDGETQRRFVDAAGMAAELNRELDLPDTRAQIARDQKIYTLLGLIPLDLDLDRSYRELLENQVVGVYDPESKQFLVLATGTGVGAGDLGALAESTYAHEFTHRLQDVHFDLNMLTDAAGDASDRQLALAALIEGDATATQLAYGIQVMGPARLLELVAETAAVGGPPVGTPQIIVDQLEFPYTSGASFVGVLRSTTGDHAGVDRAFAAPPTTSEQVMHPEKYIAGEAARSVAVADVSGALGDGWEEGVSDTLGEFFLKSWLGQIGAKGISAAAAGWGGDACKVLEGPENAHALVLRIIWDSPETDGQEFYEAITEGFDRSAELSKLAGDAATTRVWDGDGRAIGVRLAAGDGGVIVAAAPAGDQVRKLLEAAAP